MSERVRIANAAEEPVWLERASDLLSEPDPGPTPYLIDGQIVDGAVAAIQGPPKTGKTWVVLEHALSIVTGTPAFGRFEVAAPGPVIIVLEESGRAALHRRLDMLARGRAIRRDRLEGLHFSANRRVRLDDHDWQQRLLQAASEVRPRAVFFDPFARMKGAVDEDKQKEVAPVLDFMRLLRDESRAAIVFVHHTGHGGTHLRGSSDLESYWESKLTLQSTLPGVCELTADHREAEGGQTISYALRFDEPTRTVRLTPFERTSGTDTGRKRDLRCEVLDNLRASGDEWRTATEIAKRDNGGVGARRKNVEQVLAELVASGEAERGDGAPGRSNDAKAYRAVVPTPGTSPDNPSDGNADRVSPATPLPFRGGGAGQAGATPVPDDRTTEETT